MKSKFLQVMLFTAIAILCFCLNLSTIAANRYSVAVGNWNSTGTWSATALGAAGASVPVAGDVVFIQNGKNVTVTADAQAASVTFTGAAASLIINSGFTLTLSGALKLNHNLDNPTACSITGGGSLVCASVDAGSYLSLNGDHSAIITSTLNSFNITGNVTIYAKASGSNYAQASFRVEEGTTTVGGQITGTIDLSPCIGTVRMTTGSVQTGTLILNGITPWGNLTNVTTTLNGTGATVVYNSNSTQTIHGTTYTNLKVNTGGPATLDGATTISGILYMTKGSLILDSHSLIYGASSSLYYNGTTAQTVGAEWPATFAKNITISNTSGVALNENKIYNSSGLISVSGFFDFGTYYISGTAALTLASSGTLASAYVTGNEGFGNASDNTKGSIRLSGARSLGTTGNFILNGTGIAQNTGTNMPVSVGNLTIDNAAGVSLSQDVLVNGNLSLTNGLLTPGLNTLTASGTISSASSSAYVNGKLAQVFSTAGLREFPVGKGGNYRPVTLNYSSLTGNSTVSVEQIESTIPGLAPPNTSKFSARHWTISQSGGSAFNYTITLDGTGFIPTGTAVMLSGDGITNQAYAVGSPNYTNVTALTTFSSNYGLGDMSNPSVFNVVGSGVYCSGTSGTAVGLDGSEIGVTYTLYKDNVAQMSAVSGTGLAVSFGNQLAGTYTVKGTNFNGTTTMTGSAIVTMNPAPTAFAVTGGGSYCTENSGVSIGLSNSDLGFDYTLWRGASNVGSLTGTGTALDFGLQTVGVYTVTALNNSTLCTNQMIGNATITLNPASIGGTATGSNSSITIGQATGNITLSGNAGSITKWQRKIGDGDFADIALSSGLNPYSEVPAQVAVYQYRAVVQNGTCAEAYSLPTIITVNNTPLATLWTGALDSDWKKSGNWNPGVPGSNTAVTIPSSAPNFPTVTAATSVASITINNGGSFIGSEFLTAGTSTVNRTFVNNKWHFLSSPVVSSTFAGVFSPNALLVWAKEWNPATNAWVYKTGTQSFVVGKGYSVGTSAPPVTANFTGTFNSTAVTIPLIFNNSVNPTWNLLGNPFQSAIDWDNLLLAGSVGASVAVYNGTNYVYWNGTVGELAEGIIPAENGFFVSTIANGASVTIPLASRVHSNIPFYKENVADVLELEVIGNDATDKTFIHFNNNASDKYDSRYDAMKIWGLEDAPQLFSLAEGNPLAINELPLEGNEIVDIGFKCNVSGEFSFSAKGIESFILLTPIMLEDTKTGFIQDLRSNPVYTFSYSTTENANRFKLHFKAMNTDNAQANNGITVHSEPGNIVINNANNLEGEVSVYDIIGREFTHKALNSHTKTIIPMDVAVGTYLVKVVTSEKTFNQKVIIR
jgi:hypothetical protein